MAFDVVLSGGIILSAENGYEPFIGSVAFENGRIARLKHGPVPRGDAREWIDARGKS
jgi:5-methylthioadenosine/S-adenosylhomocysteine deaminase